MDVNLILSANLQKNLKEEEFYYNWHCLYISLGDKTPNKIH